MLVDPQRVGLYSHVVLQPLFVGEEVEPRRLGLRDLVLEEEDGVVDDGNLVHQAVVRGIVAGLDVGPMIATLQSSLGHLESNIDYNRAPGFFGIIDFECTEISQRGPEG